MDKLVLFGGGSLVLAAFFMQISNFVYTVLNGSGPDYFRTPAPILLMFLERRCVGMDGPVWLRSGFVAGQRCG
jgi:hypothetical protein